VALNGGGSGLLARAQSGAMSMSALPFTDEELAAVTHPHLLPRSSATVLVLSAGTLGVGSAGCGPRPLPQHILYNDPVTFSCVLQPVNTSGQALVKKAREPLLARTLPLLVAKDKQGWIELKSNDPSARITYALNNGTGQNYTGPLDGFEGGELKFMAVTAGALPYSGEMTLPKAGRRGAWKAISASSFERGEGEIAHAVDGDPSTFWHSRWSENAANPPHHIVIDLGKTLNLAAITYTARGDSENGRVRDYEIYLGANTNEWGTSIATGRLRNTEEPQTISLPNAPTGRYLKFVAQSEVQGRPWATIAELEIVPTQ
jgi:beta-galactosidase